MKVLHRPCKSFLIVYYLFCCGCTNNAFVIRPVFSTYTTTAVPKAPTITISYGILPTRTAPADALATPRRFSTSVPSMTASSVSEAKTNKDDMASRSKEPETMRIGEIKQELESYGISTRSFLEKSELVQALIQARADGLTPIRKRKQEEPKPEPAQDTTASPSSSRSSSSTGAAANNDNKSSSSSRVQRLQEEIGQCQGMKISQLKQELTERGISTASFFEKSELVQALAEARVDGISRRSSSSSSSGGSGNREGYAEYKNVEVLTSPEAGPRPKQSVQEQQQQRQPQQSPFGGVGGPNPFGGAIGGMGGMGGIADLLKNMGMGGAGAPGGASPFGASMGANPFGGRGGMGGMGGMGDMMGKAQEMMKNPKVREIMAKAQSNPRIMAAMQECMSNPAAGFAKYKDDPEVGELIKELQQYL